MRGRQADRGVSLLRGALATAVIGHWVANALFDRDEYVGAPSATLEHLHHPAIIQTILVLAGIALLTVWGGRRVRSGRGSLFGRLGPFRTALLLAGAEVLLFASMEISERLAIGSLFDEPIHFELFGSGFVAELLVAVTSALILALLGVATTQLVRALRARCRARPSPCVWIRRLEEFAPAPRVLAGEGGVRAPPAS